MTWKSIFLDEKQIIKFAITIQYDLSTYQIIVQLPPECQWSFDKKVLLHHGNSVAHLVWGIRQIHIKYIELSMPMSNHFST